MLDPFPHNKPGRDIKKLAKNLPVDFCIRAVEIFPDQSNLATLVKGLKTIRPTTFRVNTLKSTRQQIEKILIEKDIPFTHSNWYPDAFIVPFEFDEQIVKSDEFKNGLIYVQSLSSMLPPLILDPKPGETVLDLCAAPGSKTTQMAAMMKNEGQIIANDNSRIRSYRLQGNIRIQAVTNTKTFLGPGQAIWQRFGNVFDKVLADVPCSLEGRFNINDPDSFRQWTTKEVKKLSDRQKFLLLSAISATKKGGEIVYSTCTLSPEENEEVVDWILKKEAENIEVLPIEVPGLTLTNSLLKWKNKTYIPEVVMSKRIIPNETFEGFFVAKFKKIV